MAKVSDRLCVLGAVSEQGYPSHGASSRDGHTRGGEHAIGGEGAGHSGAVLQLYLGTARCGNLGRRREGLENELLMPWKEIIMNHTQPKMNGVGVVP